eukprot:scaffold93325_cov60-Phaeocystis_antarctica.AAC.2
MLRRPQMLKCHSRYSASVAAQRKRRLRRCCPLRRSSAVADDTRRASPVLLAAVAPPSLPADNVGDGAKRSRDSGSAHLTERADFIAGDLSDLPAVTDPVVRTSRGSGAVVAILDATSNHLVCLGGRHVTSSRCSSLFPSPTLLYTYYAQELSSQFGQPSFIGTLF